MSEYQVPQSRMRARSPQICAGGLGNEKTHVVKQGRQPTFVRLSSTRACSPSITFRPTAHAPPSTTLPRTHFDSQNMARRTPQPSSRAAAAPSYIQSRPDPNEGAFSRFLRTEVWAPEKRAGNISLLVGVGMFVGGIVGVRTFGDALVPI